MFFFFFWVKAKILIDPIIKRSRALALCLIYLHFFWLRSTASSFRVTGHFETSAPNDPPNNIEHQKVNGTLYTRYNYPRLPNSVLLFREPFLSYKPFETSAQNDRKMTWTLKNQRYPIYMVQLPTTPKFQSVSLYSQPFDRHRPLWDKCTEWLQNDLKH